TAGSYFYAMEFVEGETLEKLIKRSGRLEVKLALKIATQVSAGLAAVHEQNLVHRDICPLQEAMFLVERRMSLFWIMRGQRRKSTSLQSLPGLGLESPHSSTIGFDGWLLNTIAPRSLSLAGPFTDRAVVEVLPQQMNFSMPLSLGLATQIRGLD